MLAVVQHQQRLAVLQRAAQPVQAVRGRAAQALAHPERGEDRVRDAGAVGQRGQFDQAGVRVRAGGLDRQPGLARAAGAGEESGDAGEFAVPADEAGQLRGQPGPVRRGPGPPEQFQVQGRQLGGGVRAQLVGEGAPGLLVHGERLGGPPGHVQGPHQLAVQPLGERMTGEQRPQLRHQLGTAAEGQVRLDAVLDGGQPQLGEAGGLGVRVRQVRQGRAAPQGERRPQPVGRPRGITPGEGGTALPGQPRGAVGVDRVRRYGEAVAGRDGLDRRVRAEPSAQAGDLRLERVGGPRGRLGAVQAVGQLLGGDGAPGGEQQQGEQGAGARAAGIDGSAVVGADVQRAQDAEAHSPDCGRRGACPGVGYGKKPAHRGGPA